MPTLAAYIPAEHPTQLGVVVAVQLPVKYVPAVHELTQPKQAVCVPADE